MGLWFGLHPVKLVLAFNMPPVMSASTSIIGNAKTKQEWKHSCTRPHKLPQSMVAVSSSAVGISTSFCGKFHSSLREGEPRSNLVV